MAHHTNSVTNGYYISLRDKVLPFACILFIWLAVALNTDNLWTLFVSFISLLTLEWYIAHWSQSTLFWRSQYNDLEDHIDDIVERTRGRK